jgi:hypothetical protein
MKNSRLFAIMAISGAIAFGTSCKKEEPDPRDGKVGGCLDSESPLYNADADYDDESCKYAYTASYEISYHPENDEDGDNWDLFTNTDADLILKIREVGATNWMFESAEISNQAHNVAAVWTAPTLIKLMNKQYEWELWDADSGTGDDFVSSGTFNPIELADANNIITLGTNSASEASQLKIAYTLGD